ncbi:hypothetical protein LCGC14_2759690, partial [marine sediment metagenome]
QPVLFVSGKLMDPADDFAVDAASVFKYPEQKAFSMHLFADSSGPVRVE